MTIETNLISYWKLDNNGLDSFGTNDLTVTGGSYTTGVTNQGFSVGKNTTDYLIVPYTVMNGLTDFSVAMSVKFTTNTTTNCFMSGYRTGVDSLTLAYDVASSRVFLQIEGNVYYFSNSGIINDARWHNLVFQRSSTTGRLFIDGVQVGGDQTVVSTALNIASGGLIIGQEQDSIGDTFDANQSMYGVIDEIRIWSRAITSAEVASINLASGWSTGALYFLSEEVAQSSSIDYNNGTITTGKLTSTLTQPAVEDGTGLPYSSLGTAVGYVGWKIRVKRPCTLTNVRKNANVGDTRCRLLDSGRNTLATVSFSGNNATFNYALTADTIYYIAVDNNGVSRAIWGFYPGVQYAYSGDNIDIMACDNAGTDDLTRIFDIEGVTTQATSTTDSPLVWYKFDSTSGTTAIDSSGNGNDAPTTVSWVTGKINNAGDTNAGTTNIGSITAFQQQGFTVCMWMFRDVAWIPATTQSLFTYATTNKGILIQHNGTTMSGYIGDGSAFHPAVFPTVSALAWHHIALTWDGKTLIAYTDGVAGTPGIYANHVISYTGVNNTYIGFEQSTSAYFKGKIDDFRFFGHALTPTQILEIYNNGNGMQDNIGNTLLYYLTANGGSNWENVTSGVLHSFTNTGTDLRWKAVAEGTVNLTNINITDYH